MYESNFPPSLTQEESIYKFASGTAQVVKCELFHICQNGGEEFILGPLKVIPNIKASFPRRHRLGLYLEVYDLEVDAATKNPSVEVSYILETKGGAKIPVGKEFESRFAEGHSIAVSKAIPLENIPPGKYHIIVRIIDLLTQRTCTLEGSVEIL